MSNECKTVDHFSRLEQQITELQANILSQKSVLTFEEAARYTGFSRSYLYKLTSLHRIPFSKPAGKMIFFSRVELDTWLLKNQAAKEEIETQAATYVTMNKRGGRS